MSLASNIVEIKDFHLFSQAIEGMGADELKSVRSELSDKLMGINAEITSREMEGQTVTGTPLANARINTVRKLNHIDGLLSRKKSSGRWIMWVVERVEGKVMWTGWVATTIHPVTWLCGELGENDEGTDVDVPHFYAITEEQYRLLPESIERIEEE